MNNYWYTNFRTQQEGEFKFHYYLTSTPDPSRTFAMRFGWGSRVPLVARVLPPVKTDAARAPRQLSVLTLTAPNLLVVETRTTRNGEGLFLQVREVEGQPVTLTERELRTTAALQSADEVNVLEETLRGGIEALTFKPYEVKFVRLVFR